MADFSSIYLDEVFRSLRGHKRLGDDAIAQLTDEQFFAALGADENSVAIIVQHMAGNMRSRFTDFLTTDGEKPDRHRDQEFLATGAKRAEIMRAWEQGWHTLFDTINSLQPADFERTVTIRAQPHSVLQALQRAMSHLAYHTGQVVFLAKHWKGAAWESLSVPKGQSEQHTAKIVEKYKTK